MPRGDNPNSKRNLKPVRSKEEARERGKKGGKASGETRRAYSSFRECFNANMDDEKRKKMFDMLYGRAMRGNLKAFEILRDTMGERPTETVEVNKVDPESIKEVEEFINGAECGEEEAPEAAEDESS